MKIEEKLTAAVVSGLKALYGQDVPAAQVQLQKTKKEFEGHLTLVVFPFLRMSRKGPEQTAQEIGEYLTAHEPAVAAYNVIKGFLNLTVAPAAWIELLDDIHAQEQYGLTPATPESPLVMIEYSSPNTNKPLHLGHVRNNLLGNALANIIAANGNRVVKTNIVNDRGIHICKSMLAWLKYGNGETPESSGKKGDHLIGDYYVAFDKHYKAEVNELMEQGMTKEEAEAASPLMKEAREMLVKWEAGDPEVRALWKKMNDWVYAGFDETYRMMGVSFDKIYYESNTYLEGKKKVLEGLDKGLFYRKEDGSVWADLTNEGLDHKLLLRSDGTSVYMTQDIGTAEQRFADYPIDKMIYVVGNEQNYHFQVLSILLDRLGFEWGKSLVHFSYGMVELPEGKMKSREGTVVDADDLMAEMIATARETSGDLGKLEGLTPEEAEDIARIVGLGALKYFILKVDARKNMTFNPKESIDFNGNTGPFIQYTYARIRSVLRKAAEAGITLPARLPEGISLSTKEEGLVQMLADFAAVVRQAGTDYSPSVIANYCYDLVKEYNQFYHDFSILREENECRGFDLVVHDRYTQQQFADGVVHAGQDALLDDFLHDEGDAGYDLGTDFCERLGYDFGRGHPCQEVQVRPGCKAIEKVVNHAEHMPQRQHGDDSIAGIHAQHLAAIIHIAPQAAVGQHDAFGVARGTRGVIDDRQFVGRSLAPVMDVLGAEILGVAGAVTGIAVLEGFHQRIIAADHRGEVFQQDDTFEVGHDCLVQGFPGTCTYEEQFGFGVIDDMMDVVRLELMEDGDDDCAVCHGCQEGNPPVSAVASAYGDLVARADAGTLQDEVELGYLPCHVLVLQGDTLVISQGVEVPILYDALFDVFDKGGCSFHYCIFVQK